MISPTIHRYISQSAPDKSSDERLFNAILSEFHKLRPNEFFIKLPLRDRPPAHSITEFKKKCADLYGSIKVHLTAKAANELRQIQIRTPKALDKLLDNPAFYDVFVTIPKYLGIDDSDFFQKITNRSQWAPDGYEPIVIGEIHSETIESRISESTLLQMATIIGKPVKVTEQFYFELSGRERAASDWHIDKYDQRYFSVTFSDPAGGTEYLILPQFIPPTNEHSTNETNNRWQFCIDALIRTVLLNPENEHWIRPFIRHTIPNIVYADLITNFYHRSPRGIPRLHAVFEYSDATLIPPIATSTDPTPRPKMPPV